MRPNPMAKKATAPKAKSIRFFIMMLTAFLARVKPVSTMAKPACMRKTRKAATSVQMKLRLVCTLSAVTSSARASKGTAARAAARVNDRMILIALRPPRRSAPDLLAPVPLLEPLLVASPGPPRRRPVLPLHAPCQPGPGAPPAWIQRPRGRRRPARAAAAARRSSGPPRLRAAPGYFPISSTSTSSWKVQRKEDP